MIIRYGGIRGVFDEALKALNETFNALYADRDRGSIPPDKRLRAQRLMALYPIRNERLRVEQIDDNRLFLWLVGFSMDNEVRSQLTFSRNQDRLLERKVTHQCFSRSSADGARAGLWDVKHRVSTLSWARLPATRFGYAIRGWRHADSQDSRGSYT